MAIGFNNICSHREGLYLNLCPEASSILHNGDEVNFLWKSLCKDRWVKSGTELKSPAFNFRVNIELLKNVVDEKVISCICQSRAEHGKERNG